MKIQHLLAIVAITLGAATTASAHKVADIELHIDGKGPHLNVGTHRHHDKKPQNYKPRNDKRPRHWNDHAWHEDRDYYRPYRRAAKLERRAERAFDKGRVRKAYRLMRKAYNIRVEADRRRAAYYGWHPRHGKHS